MGSEKSRDSVQIDFEALRALVAVLSPWPEWEARRDSFPLPVGYVRAYPSGNSAGQGRNANG